MGVNSVNGPALAAMSSKDVSLAPDPRLRTQEAATKASSQVQAAVEVKEEQVQRAASSVEAIRAKPVPSRTRFRVDQESKQIIAQIVDENNELIRQIPPEELLNIAARFRKFNGVLFDERA